MACAWHRLLACMAAAVAASPALASPNLLINGSFETGNPNWPQPVAGWTSRSGGTQLECSARPGDYGIPAAPAGSNFCEVEYAGLSPNSTPDWLEQTITSTAGERYFMSAQAVNRINTDTLDRMVLQAAGVNLATITTNNSWTQYQSSFNASAATTVIRYISNGASTGYTQPGDSAGLMLDNAQVQELTVSPASLTTAEDTAVTSTALQTASNTGLATQTEALSVSNGVLTLLSTTGLTFTTGSNGSASFTVSGTAAAINAAFAAGLRYTPTADYNGAATLTYTATAGAVSDTDTVPITVTPVADIVADALTTLPNTAITFNAITGTNGASADNFENTPTAVSVTAPSSGTAVASTTTLGQITYTPAPGFSGTATFTYTVTSGGRTETANISVTVPAPNPRLTVLKSANTAGPVSANQVITYSYRITNSGNVPLTAITVADVHNGSGAFSSIANEVLTTDVAPTGDTTDGGQNGIWNNLGIGDSVTFTATYQVSQQDIDTLQ